MKTSIVIPNYKNKEGVVRALGLCARQEGISFENLEIIIVNDGEESWFDVVGNSKETNKLQINIINQKRTGVAGARNSGINNSKGEIILFLDCDCVPSVNWVKQMLLSFCSDKGIDGVAGKIIPLIKKKSLVNSYFNATNRLGEPIIENSKIVGIITANSGFRKDSIKSIGGFNSRVFDKNVHGGEDIDLTMRLNAANLRLAYNSDALVCHEYPYSLKSIFKKYYHYGKGLALACLSNGVEPSSIRQPSYSAKDIFKYFFMVFSKIKSDFHIFRKENIGIFQSSLFCLFESIRRTCHLVGFMRVLSNRNNK